MNHLLQGMMRGPGLQTMATAGLVVGGLAAGSYLLCPEREQLTDIPVRTDYLANDSLFVDAVLMLKPYRAWAEEEFDKMLTACDSLAFYAQSAATDTEAPMRTQLYALHQKRVIDSCAAKLLDVVCRHMPEERALATDNRDALLTVVDSYVDSVQNDCRDRARFVGSQGPGIRASS